jgi:hypothetical protein
MKLQILGVALLGVALLAGQARAETINFDNLAAGVIVTNQYPDVIFSSNPGEFVVTYHQSPPYQSSPPNLICTGTSGVVIDCTSDITLTFAAAVDNLTFNAYGNQRAVGSTFAVAAVYLGGPNPAFQQNLTVTHTQAQDTAANCQIMDCLADPQTLNYIGISKVVIHSNTDPNGTAYDEFNFAVEGAPEPSTLLLTGLCGIVWAGRRFLGRKPYSR